MTSTLKGKKTGVLGMARSGIAAANMAHSMGASVLVSEVREKKECAAALQQLAKGIRHEFGGHSKALLGCDIIVKSPGIHRDITILKKADGLKIPVVSEIELASRLITPSSTIAITGTNGKTTTTTLMGELCKNAGRKTIVAGNIGDPLAAHVVSITPKTTVVLEVSSYQLEDSPEFHPDICAILNITPDHIEHHHTMENYALAKAKIFGRQSKDDTCVLNYDDPACRKLARSCPGRVIFFSRKKIASGVYFHKGRIEVRLPFAQYSLPAKLKIPGMHNIENAMAAVAMAAAAGIAEQVIKKTLAEFKGVEHRMEFVAEINGVRYINDSKGTNVDSTVVALRSFNKQGVWLILGGRDKGAPYKPLEPLIKKNVRGILLIGEAANKIRKELSGSTAFYFTGTLETAVELAASLAKRGEIVLLSPACASFDQFKDYEDRGRRFKDIVKKKILSTQA
ncbi:MAG: UDP-N-acetylmuramoylalanine--D-glutamate ligase [Elusimicrobia bacterium RIFOXYB2_FULL_50_12]|nr:MAG: UDP-N-acetylmuramoylalanine--D-glutamate ligase [Elusimicrobia bacterium RIFOXYB2_FULL_50_12]